MTMLFNPRRLKYEALAEATEPPPPVDYLKWAVDNIVFSERITDHPGPYDPKLVPYFNEVLTALSPDDPCSIVSLSKSAQLGGTFLANIFTLGTMDMDPCDFLYTHPTDDNAARWSKAKLMPMIRELGKRLFSDSSRDGGNSIHYKERIDGRGAVQVSGANSPASLSMISPRKQVQDDLAKWGMNDAGDPEAQADSRSKAFFNRKVLKISTPLIAPGCRITTNYHAGTEERYHVPCPHCHELQALEWENMRDHIDPEHPEQAHFVCVHCGCELHEHHRAWMVDPANGAKWVAKHPERARRHRSFHIWVAYSPFESWEAIALAWLRVQRGGPDDKEKGAGAEQTFWNDWLGLPFEADNRAVDWEELRDRAEDPDLSFERGVIPAEALALAIGSDVQGDRVEWQLVGYGRNRFRCVIDRGVIDHRAGSHLPGYRAHSGHIAEPEVRDALDRLLERTWPDEWGNRRACDILAIDGNAYTEDVWGWARRHPKSRVIMVRGDNRDAARLLSQVREYDRKGRPKKQKWAPRFFNFNASIMKIGLYRDLRKDDPEQTGYIGFARGLGDDFFQQVTSEVRVAERTKAGYPRYVWKLPAGTRNEALDMMNQAHAGAIRLGVTYWTEEEWDALHQRLSTMEKPAQADLEDFLTPVAPAAKPSRPAAKGRESLSAASLMKQLNE